MGKRKMLRNTTVFISVLVILTLLLGSYFLVYRGLSSYNRQIELMQKDILGSFQMKADSLISDCTNRIASWMLDERAIDFLSEDEVNYYDLERFYIEEIAPDLFSQNTGCIFGIFSPGQDVFLTNVGILHCWNLERRYGFTSELVSLLSDLPEKEFVYNYYVPDHSSGDGKRVLIFMKRSSHSVASGEFYGFISLNMSQIVEQMSDQEENHFMVYNDRNCLYKRKGTAKNIHTLKQPSDVIYSLSYSCGVESRTNFLVWPLYGFLFIVLVYVGLLLSSYLAKRLHKPIEDILHQLSDDDAAEIYDEAAYIQNRFVAVKEENQQLTAQVHAQESSLKQNFIRDLLYGLVSDDMLFEKGELYGVKNLCGRVSLAILEERKSEHPGIVDFSRIISILEGMFASEFTIFLNSKQLVVVSRQPFDSFKKDLVQIILQIGEEQGVNYTGAVVDGELSEPTELTRLFNEGMLCLENSALGNDKLIISKEDLHERAEHDYYYPMELERSIISYITDHDFDRALKLLQSILDKNLVDMKLNKAAMIELKFAVVGTVKRILHVLKKSEAELFGEGTVLYLELNACKTPEEISKKIYEMFSAIRKYSETAYDTNNYALIDSIEDYIHQNFNRSDMSLFLLAEHFNLTVSYISSIFKKYRQINFKDYLTSYRIRKAIEILDKEPQIRISELAVMVGYENVNSFIRNFKKLKHVSPGEYKNNTLES